MVTTKYIIIEKSDEVYIKVEGEDYITRELSEHFTFMVPGYTFMPAFRSRNWDGKIRLYNYKTKKIYKGLYPYILHWCKENGIQVVDGTGIKDVKIDEDVLSKFIKALKVPLEIRDYQIEAFKHSIRKNRCLLLSPTGSGKSLIIYLMVIYNLIRLKEKKDNKILIVVPTTSLVEQLFKDFKDYGYNSERNIHRIYQGHAKETKKRVVISTWQSIYKQPKKWFNQFGMVIGDEAHLFKADSLTSIVTKLVNCKYKVGLTGTLDGSKTHKLVLEGLFGAVNKVISTSELQDKDQLSKLKIFCLVLKHDKNARDFLKDKTYQEEMDYLVSNTKRNKYIRNLATSLKGNTLCLFNYVEKHGMVLKELMEEKHNGKKIHFVYGGVETEDRESIRQLVDSTTDNIICASYGTFSTGVNIRNLHNIIFASPTKSRIRNLQSIGRGLRLKDNNLEARLYDIADDASSGDKENYTLNHFRSRVEIYTEENFEYEIHNVEL